MPNESENISGEIFHSTAVPENINAESSSSSDSELILSVLQETKEETGGFFVNEIVLKAKLKYKFDPDDWASTHKLRLSDVAKEWPMISLKSHWPFLFKPEGVISLN